MSSHQPPVTEQIDDPESGWTWFLSLASMIVFTVTVVAVAVLFFAFRVIYVFMYGNDYRGAVGALMRISGAQPVPPRHAFGVAWSRYWQFSAAEMARQQFMPPEHYAPCVLVNACSVISFVPTYVAILCCVVGIRQERARGNKRTWVAEHASSCVN